MIALGIDPSLSRTGVAVIEEDADVPVRVFSLPTSGHRYDSVPQRWDRIRRIAYEATPSEDVLLAAIEGPSFGSVGGSAWDRAGLWWQIVGRLMRDDIPTGIVAPRTRAKWATGDGNAGKQAVQHAMAALWPSVSCVNDDEVDALALATMAAQQAGMDVPVLDRHHVSLAAAQWPELAEIELSA